MGLREALDRTIGKHDPPLEPGPELLYLDLLKGCLTRSLFGEATAYDPSVGAEVPFDAELRSEGRDWPEEAETMIGLKRLENLQQCVTGDRSRIVWAADSFEGLPRPDGERYPADEGSRYHEYQQLAIPLETVKANFARYGLLDGQVGFLPGWFRDTLPSTPIERLAVLRLDGDMYESTMVALEALYPKVAEGGYVIVDDYKLPRCRAAVDDYRAQHGITDPLTRIDWTGVFWQRA